MCASATSRAYVPRSRRSPWPNVRRQAGCCDAPPTRWPSEACPQWSCATNHDRARPSRRPRRRSVVLARLRAALAKARHLRIAGDYPAAASGLRSAITEAEGVYGPHAPEPVPALNEPGMTGKYRAASTRRSRPISTPCPSRSVTAPPTPTPTTPPRSCTTLAASPTPAASPRRRGLGGARKRNGRNMIAIERLYELPLAERRAGLEDLVVAEFKTTLMMADDEDLPFDMSYFELGFTSLGITEIKERLETQLGRSVSTNVLFNSPTMERLVAYLVDEVLTDIFGSMPPLLAD